VPPEEAARTPVQSATRSAAVPSRAGAFILKSWLGPHGACGPFPEAPMWVPPEAVRDPEEPATFSKFTSGSSRVPFHNAARALPSPLGRHAATVSARSARLRLSIAYRHKPVVVARAQRPELRRPSQRSDSR
jgi:hypothetical protein